MAQWEMVNEGNALQGPRFMVIGVGGAGGNAVQYMVDQGIKNANVTFVCANTDKQDLDRWTVEHKIQLGAKLNRGLGAGANPEAGKSAALEEEAQIRGILEGVDMVFIAAGMGGGTGTGAAPVIARIAREIKEQKEQNPDEGHGVMIVGVVSTPFKLEGSRRAKVAAAGIEELSNYVDAMIVVPNDKVMEIYGNMSVVDAYARANDVLMNAVQGVTQVVVKESNVTNTDFMDLRTAMQAKGHAMMGIGRASGDNRATQAVQKAIRSPLQDGLNLNSIQGVIVNIVASKEVLLNELDEIGNYFAPMLDNDAEVFYGMTIDEGMGDDLEVTVIVTGLKRIEPAQARPAPNPRTATNPSTTTQAPASQTSIPKAPVAPSAQPSSSNQSNALSPGAVQAYLRQKSQTNNH